jgi:aminopeptidase N
MTLVGRDGFRKGMDLYFQRHDGQAVTCDDFAQAMADANPGSQLTRLLPQFKRWYSQAGTPVVKATGQYDAAARTYTLTLAQSCPATPGQPHKQPFVIPVRLGLVGADGQDLPLQLAPGHAALHGDVFVLDQAQATLTFADVASAPVPSLLRGFSAPVELDCDYTAEQLLHLLAHDSDPFNRWEAGQQIGLRIAIDNIAASAHQASARPLNDAYISALRALLRDPTLDAAFKTLVLTLPDEDYIAEQLDSVDPQRIHAVADAMELQLALELQGDWQQAYEQNHDTGAYRPDPVSAGRRALAGLALHMLCLAATTTGDVVWPGKAYQRFKDAGNMTDRLNALEALVYSGHELAARALKAFYIRFRDEPLALDKWFSLQARMPDRGGQVLPVVRELMRDPAFQLRNPNRARSLIFGYCHANPAAFHRRDAAGYVFWADRVLELDAINPQIAARLARAMDPWSRLAEPYRAAAHEAIARVAARAELSNDVREVITRALAADAPPAPAADAADAAHPEARTAPTPDTETKDAP